MYSVCIELLSLFPFSQKLCKVIGEASTLSKQLETVRAENMKISKVRTITSQAILTTVLLIVIVICCLPTELHC